MLYMIYVCLWLQSDNYHGVCLLLANWFEIGVFAVLFLQSCPYKRMHAVYIWIITCHNECTQRTIGKHSNKECSPPFRMFNRGTDFDPQQYLHLLPPTHTWFQQEKLTDQELFEKDRAGVSEQGTMVSNYPK